MALTKAQLVDMNANELILDLDADTSLHASTDDQIDIKIGGADDFTFTANTFTALAGSSIVTPTLSVTSSATISGGAINLAAIDIDGGTDIGAAVADADLFIIDDGAGGTNRKVTAARVKTYMGAEGGAFSVANLDIDGATDIGAAIVDADLFIIDDGAGGTNRKVAASRIKTYIGSSTAADDLTIGDAAVTLSTSSGNITLDATANDSDIIFKGTDNSSDITMLTLDGSAAGAAIFNSTVTTTGLVIGSTAVTSTPAELNLIDGGATIGTTAVADGDGVLHNDGGTMKVTSAATFKTYFQEGISQAYDDFTIGDAAVLITTSSGNITVDAAANDSDIILKGTDGGVDTTFLTIDGSAAGDATFNNQIIVGDGKLVLGSTAVTSTAAELNILDDATVTTAEINLIDGGTARGTTAVATGDGILINDGGTMRMTNVDTVSTYFAGHNVGGGNIVTTGALDSGSITSGFGAIDNGTSNIRSATITAETAFVPDAANGATLGTASLEFADMYLHDGGIVYFGADQDVELAHVADVGLTLKTATTSDDTKATLTLQTGDTDIAANDVLGQLHFQAPDEGAGTDAVLVAAGIAAISEGDFSASNNATKLSFQTGASEAASEKMSLSSGGILTVADDIIIGDGKTIGSASTVDAITIASNGVTTFSQIPVLPANSIDSDYYVDGSIDTAHIADGQITTAKLATAVFTGATDIGAAIADADLFLMDDGAGGTIRKTAASRIKTYAGSPAGTLGFGGYRASSNFSISATTQTEIVFNSEYYDPSGKYNVSNGRFTPGVAGDYFIACSVAFDPSADMNNADVAYLKLRKNGTGLEQGQIFFTGSDIDQKLALSTSSIFTLDDDDYVSAWWYSQEAGVLLSVSAWLHGFRIA
jgi:hypothetical protein